VKFTGLPFPLDALYLNAFKDRIDPVTTLVKRFLERVQFMARTPGSLPAVRVSAGFQASRSTTEITSALAWAT
jgi:hypothetical protein